MIQNTDLIDNYYNVLLENKIISSRKNLERKYNSLFQDLVFTNKTVLDIGGGVGITSFYMASMGAKEVINLEPEDSGSRTDLLEKFNKIKLKLTNMEHVEFIPETFQNYDPQGKKFDIILLDQSINHLDENACENLLINNRARETYLNIFNKLYLISFPNSKLVISDCSRYNFFDSLNIKNPIAPSIEWEKHQSPEVWIKYLRNAGFYNPILSWRSNNKFGKFGDIFFTNKVISYFFNSHFDLMMDKNSVQK